MNSVSYLLNELALKGTRGAGVLDHLIAIPPTLAPMNTTFQPYIAFSTARFLSYDTANMKTSSSISNSEYTNSK
jgi:hypothetical protein